MAGNYHKDPEAVSRLTPEQYRVTQKNGTEPPFRNEYLSLIHISEPTRPY